MRKAKLIVSCLSLVAVMALAMPTAVHASEGPQGGSNSTKGAPPPPPPPPSGGGAAGVLGEIIAFLMS